MARRTFDVIDMTEILHRTPRDAEWEEFLGHFERRHVALGECGRSYSTPCIPEHSCFSELTAAW